jgi:hypothetical protein
LPFRNRNPLVMSTYYGLSSVLLGIVGRISAYPIVKMSDTERRRLHQPKVSLIAQGKIAGATGAGKKNMGGGSLWFARGVRLREVCGKNKINRSVADPRYRPVPSKSRGNLDKSNVHKKFNGKPPG